MKPTRTLIKGVLSTTKPLSKLDMTSCGLFDEKYKYIVRDKCGDLFVYETKPVKHKYPIGAYVLGDDGGTFCYVGVFPEVLFRNVKWEDDEPTPLFIDWANLPVDTKLLVQKNHMCLPYYAHFARYIANRVYIFTDGKTSHTCDYDSIFNIQDMEYARLCADDDKQYRTPTIVEEDDKDDSVK